MSALVEEIMEESDRYFNLDREEYVEGEGEMRVNLGIDDKVTNQMFLSY